jgi:excinuclease ABC subunit A
MPSSSRPSNRSSSSKKTPNNYEIREPDFIEVRGSREHNLHIDELLVPKRKFVVFTGVSGSGKSSLAFDTLYAEGQRRYVETLSAYARQFLGQLERPNVDHLRGLSPTIAIEQKSAGGNPRSTVGTVTEIYDYLRVLYARVGEQRCPTCGKAVKSRSPEEIVRAVYEAHDGAQITILAPLAIHRKGEYAQLFRELAQRGFLRVKIDGTITQLENVPKLAKNIKHTIHLVIDRIRLDGSSKARVTESIELALREGDGELHVDVGKETTTFSQKRACCGKSFPELSPQSFSFNSPLGMCGTCNGLGTELRVDDDLVIPDPSLSIRDGAIAPWATSMARGEGWTFRIADAVAKACDVNLDIPWKNLNAKKRNMILHGIADRKVQVSWGSEKSSSHGTWGMKFEGVVPAILRRYEQASSDASRDQQRRFLTEQKCSACEGHRLRTESGHVFVGKRSITEVVSMTVREAADHFRDIQLSSSAQKIAEGALREIRNRLGFLLSVRLDYLTLERSAPTLSGGESQRIRLASQLGSELSGVIYVLDEPSIGLHSRDNNHLIATLRRLRDLGNTVVVVEHDEETILAADHVVDFGPGAGHLGGAAIFSGSPDDLARHPTSITGAYLAGRMRIEVPKSRRTPRSFVTIVGAKEHNLKAIDARFPIGVLTAVTGVSGAGKSSLVNRILLPALSRLLHQSTDPVGAHKAIKGLDAIERVIAIDQNPIGRTPRSNPGTYTKSFDLIRDVFASLPDSRTRGFDAGRFSFNVKGGRCEACSGDGMVKVEMHFLADVYVPCEVCNKKRYNAQTLAIKYKGLSISDILDTSIEDCLSLFANYPALKRILATLVDVGLGYMKIGQPAPTMSGGEAQRVKLSRELGKSQTGKTLYVLDEPTTGLHFDDTKKLLHMLDRLVEAGNSVVVIEHNLDVIKCADWVIDLGPEGGEGGGYLIAEGTPEDIVRVRGSFTGEYLAPLLKNRTLKPRRAAPTQSQRSASSSRRTAVAFP